MHLYCLKVNTYNKMQRLDPIIPDCKYKIWPSYSSESYFNICLIDLDTVTNVSSIWFPSNISVNLI